MQRDEPYPVIHIKWVDIHLNSTTINEILEVFEVPNYQFDDQLKEMNLEWLREYSLRLCAGISFTGLL